MYSICVTDKHILCGTYEKVIHVSEGIFFKLFCQIQNNTYSFDFVEVNEHWFHGTDCYCVVAVMVPYRCFATFIGEN